MISLSIYIDRDISDYVKRCFDVYPIVSISGPRQSGKSTLVKNLFSDASYITLEDEEIAERIGVDLKQYLELVGTPLIVDEAQLEPKIYNAIKTLSDQRNIPSQYILTGSQNFLLLKNVNQSLAGRVALIKLLPFSYLEAKKSAPDLTIEDFILKGGYPRTYEITSPLPNFYSFYKSTYLVRDVSPFIRQDNLSTFSTFIEACALYAGQQLNITQLANMSGISTKTARSWINILTSSNIIFFLRPYYSNKIKTLTKSPKLYFYDSGLLCNLLAIQSVEELLVRKEWGSIFENFVVSETYKLHNNLGNKPELYYYRDDSKREIDLIDATDHRDIRCIEIKSTKSFNSKFVRHLHTVPEKLQLNNMSKHLVLNSDESYPVGDVLVHSIKDYVTDHEHFHALYY